MKIKLLVFFIIMMPFVSRAQGIPLNANVIIVHGVTLNEVVNRLLDSGYTINKIDSNFNTVATDIKKISIFFEQDMILYVRIKDSIAYFTGTFGFPENKGQYAPGTMGAAVSGNTSKIANIRQWQKRKKSSPFALMNTIAQSFNKPIEYKIQ